MRTGIGGKKRAPVEISFAKRRRTEGLKGYPLGTNTVDIRDHEPPWDSDVAKRESRGKKKNTYVYKGLIGSVSEISDKRDGKKKNRTSGLKVLQAKQTCNEAKEKLRWERTMGLPVGSKGESQTLLT